IHTHNTIFFMQSKIKTSIQMSRPPFFMAVLIFVLLILFMGAASASRPPGLKMEDYTTFKPKTMKEKHGFGGRRHSSAPSRYINYQPLASTMCSSIDHQVNNP
ncbi:hypothetical protein Pfo_015610, partial [Paulownia fortunei]